MSSVKDILLMFVWDGDVCIGFFVDDDSCHYILTSQDNFNNNNDIRINNVVSNTSGECYRVRGTSIQILKM